MGIDILLGVLARHTQVFHKMFLASPAPVVGPEMNVAIVYILVGTDTFIAGDIVLTSPTALASDTDEVVTVERTNEAACLCQPAFESRQRFLTESTGLVAYLPRHDGRIVHIAAMGITVGASYDKTHIVVEQLMGFLAGSILRHKLHKGRIASLVGTGSLSQASLLKIIAITSTPLP